MGAWPLMANVSRRGSVIRGIEMIITYQDSKLKIKMGYNPDKIDLIKQVPDGRKWDKRNRVWELPGTADNIEFLIREFRIDSPELAAKLAQLKSPLRDTDCGSVVFKTDPYAHQKHGFNLGMNNSKCALFWSMGTGKTWVAINCLEKRIRDERVKNALIVCPKSVISSWQREFEIHGTIKPSIIKSKKPIPPGACLVNYQLLIFIKEALMAQKWDMIILDESTYIKSTSAKVTKFVWKLVKEIPFRMILTGTPVTQGCEDLFAQFMALDDGQTFGNSFFTFRNRYFVNRGFAYPDWQLKSGALELIREKMKTRSHRITKEQCLDLPPKNYQVLEVKMLPAQAKAYKEIEKELLTIIDDVTIAIPYLMTKLIRLSQITSGFIHHDGADIELKHDKLNTLLEILQDKPKAVIWCLFRHDINIIMTALGNEAVEISGNTTGEQRGENISRFQNGDARFLVGQIRAGGIGVTLTAANFVVYYSQGYSLIDRLQSEDRTHRIGTIGTVTYVDLVSPKTVDVEILKAIKAKKDVADYVTGDKDLGEIILNNFRKGLTSKKQVIY